MMSGQSNTRRLRAAIERRPRGRSNNLVVRTTRHNKLVETAKAAIEAVFSDTSVSQQQTLESLEDLADAIQVQQQCIRFDLRRTIGKEVA